MLRRRYRHARERETTADALAAIVADLPGTALKAIAYYLEGFADIALTDAEAHAVIRLRRAITGRLELADTVVVLRSAAADPHGWDADAIRETLRG